MAHLHKMVLPKRVCFGFILATLIIPALGMAQSPYAGVYFGSYSGISAYGEFGVLVRENNTAVIATCADDGESGFLFENLSVNQDGSFSFVDNFGNSVNGVFNSTSVSGTYLDFNGYSGTFYGDKSANSGFLSDAGGYFTGPASGTFASQGITGNFTGNLSAIVDAGGRGFALMEVTLTAHGIVYFAGYSGGTITVNPDGSINGILLDGTEISGTFDAGSLSAAGSFIYSNPDASVTGNWSLTRKLPLPASGNQTGSFFDVPDNQWAFDYIEKLSASGITTGCGNGNFCPGDIVTRAQMAVFLERGIWGKDFVPPAGTGIFGDVQAGHWALGWIEQLYRDGITDGCVSRPLLYCPDSFVSRAEMAIFLLRAKHGSTYVPPTASGVFVDLPLGYWATNWIEQLYREGITGGCNTNPLTYCPEFPVTRDQMAAFLVRTFGL